MIVTQILQKGFGGFFNRIQNAATNTVQGGFSFVKNLISKITGGIDSIIAQLRTWIEGNKVAAVAVAAVAAIALPIVLPLVWAPAKALASVAGRVLAMVIKMPGKILSTLRGVVSRWTSARTMMS